MAAIALTQSENQDIWPLEPLSTHKDKMEQLLVLSFGDTTSDTRVFPANVAAALGLTPVGSINPAAPVVAMPTIWIASGNLLASASATHRRWFYQRVWEVVSISAP
jgi:hypothetical protein